MFFSIYLFQSKQKIVFYCIHNLNLQLYFFTFLLVAIMKKELKIERDLYKILQVLSIPQFEKTALESFLGEGKLQKTGSGAQISLPLGIF